MLLGCIGSVARAQTPAPIDHNAKIQKLYDAKRWEELVREVESTPQRDAEIDYDYGSGLAHLERWSEARAAFLAGRRLRPRDERFPVELGGVAFKQKRYREAAKWLHAALLLAPKDEYASDFLATIYFIEGNTEAALKYWNRAGKPRLEHVHIEPGLRIRPALLDRAIAFSPAGTLQFADYLTTEARVEGLGIFPTMNWRLEALDDGGFDVSFQAAERDGWGSGAWEALLSTFRGAFYQTAYPAYFNWKGEAINFTSLARWDAQKRRLSAFVSAPLMENPKYRYQVGFDLRNENWDLRQSAEGTAPVLGALNLRRYGVDAQVTSLASGRWSWLAGGELSYRDYRNVFAGPSLPRSVLLSGNELKQLAQLSYDLIQAPQRRFDTKAAVSSRVGTIWSNPARSFEKLQGSVVTRWFPQMRGDDYAVQWQVRSAKTFGSVPFDELFMLGMERDNDLWMRGHVGTRDGQKGSAPLGRNYFLSNWEIDKRVYQNGFFSVKLSPFLDSGKITDSLPGLGAREWLWDTGIQAKFRVLGVGVTFIYGKDLRAGHHAFYATAQ